jgi:hypothetical protein
MRVSNITIRMPDDLRAALADLAAKSSEDYGIELSSSDLLRIGAKRLLADPEMLFRPRPTEGAAR